MIVTLGPISKVTTPVITPRISSPTKILSPAAFATDVTTDTTPRKVIQSQEVVCQWCFGDYYPCRCAEKGRNTASLIDNGVPGGGISDVKLPESLDGTGTLSKSLLDRNICSPVGNRGLSRANSIGNELVKQQSNKPRNIHIMRKPVLRFPVPKQSDALCKWCLGTFSPCFCEEGIPSISNYSCRVDNDDDDDYDDNNNNDYYDNNYNNNNNNNNDNIGQYNPIRRSSSVDTNTKYNSSRQQQNLDINISNSSNSTNNSTRRSSKAGMTSFQRRLQSFSAENFDDGSKRQQSSSSYPNTVISRSSASFASNGSIIGKTKNPGYSSTEYVSFLISSLFSIRFFHF